jgi:hypothetical protein
MDFTSKSHSTSWRFVLRLLVQNPTETRSSLPWDCDRMTRPCKLIFSNFSVTVSKIANLGCQSCWQTKSQIHPQKYYWSPAIETLQTGVPQLTCNGNRSIKRRTGLIVVKPKSPQLTAHYCLTNQENTIGANWSAEVELPPTWNVP